MKVKSSNIYQLPFIRCTRYALVLSLLKFSRPLWPWKRGKVKGTWYSPYQFKPKSLTSNSSWLIVSTIIYNGKLKTCSVRTNSEITLPTGRRNVDKFRNLPDGQILMPVFMLCDELCNLADKQRKNKMIKYISFNSLKVVNPNFSQV